MIQRIQTIYLLAATSLMATFLFATLATFSSAQGLFSLSAMGLSAADGSMISDTRYLAILVGLASLLPFVTIFLFKRRMLQLRLCVVEMTLTLGVMVVGGVYYYLANRYFGAEATTSIRIVCALPIIAIIFDFLALKAIFRDEMLIKSLDRIR